MRAKKSLGQNFLMHARIAERIAIESGVTKDDTVLEIGPGTGMLTAPLLARAKKVIAVEADAELALGLEEKFASEIGEGKLELIHGDIRTFSISEHLQNSNNRPSARNGKGKSADVLEYGGASSRDPGQSRRDDFLNYAVVANIPYYITGEIMRDFLSAKAKPASMTLLVQKEVAERIARDTKGSILSIAVRAYGNPKYLFTVPSGAFVPAPNVDSAVLHIGGIRNPFPSEKAEKRFFEVLKAGFAHKRKRLAKNLEDTADGEAVSRAFSALALGENARAEELSTDSWTKLAQILT